MSRWVRDRLAEATKQVDAWDESPNGYTDAAARFRAVCTNDLRRCWAKWSAAERRAAPCTRAFGIAVRGGA